MNTHDWLFAFLLTQVIEIPIYLMAARTLPKMKRTIYAIVASTITHPIIWFCLPWETGSYVPLLIAAESFAVITEALWGRAWHVPRPWATSLLANATSVCLGSVLLHIIVQL